MYIKDVIKLIGPLQSKTKPGAQKFFNSSDIDLVRKIKIICKELPEFTWPLENEHKII